VIMQLSALPAEVRGWLTVAWLTSVSTGGHDGRLPGWRAAASPGIAEVGHFSTQKSGF
jgi:hypothetical protein